MSYFALNLLLALIWMFLTGSFNIGGLFVGFAFGFLALYLARAYMGTHGYVRAMGGSIRLLLVFLYELVVANVQLAKDILSPRPQLKPGFLAFRVHGLSPAQTVLLGNMISLTPGTLTVDFDSERETLYLHTTYAQNPDRIRRSCQLFVDLIAGATGGEARSEFQEVA